MQAKEAIKNNPRKYKIWANILATDIDKINFNKVPKYRADAMKNLLICRCKMIEEF